MAVTTALAAGTRVARPALLSLGAALGVVLVQYRAAALVMPLIAVLALVLLSWVARRHLLVATACGLAVVGALPVYAGRYVGGTQFGVTPSLAVALVLAPAALESLPRFRVVPMDVAVAAFCLLRLLSTLLNFNNKLGSAAGPAIYLASTYAVFRLLLLQPGVLRVVTRTVVALGAAAGLFAVFEHAGAGNVFFRLSSTGYAYKDFAQEQLRFGDVRAEASFGHSIALGMFLGLAMVLTIALAIQARTILARAALVVAAGLILLGTLDTLSRGAIAALSVGVLLWFLRESRRMRLSTFAGLALVAAAIVALTPVKSTVSELVASSESSTSTVAASNEHRFAILDLVSDPSQFSVLGHKSAGSGGVTNQLEQRTGLNSFDNAYALVYLANGLLAVVAFLAVGVLAFLALAAPGLNAIERGWVAGLCAAALNLFTVNLLTQYQDFFWVAAAVAAAAWQRTRHTRAARKAELVRSPS